MASHIKPWRSSTNEERLDSMNGLPLIPNLDTAFDRGLITFNPDNGRIVLSECLLNSSFDLKKLDISNKLKLRFIKPEHKGYLQYHNKFIFINI